jgi:hypothetical protein
MDARLPHRSEPKALPRRNDASITSLSTKSLNLGGLESSFRRVSFAGRTTHMKAEATRCTSSTPAAGTRSLTHPFSDQASCRSWSTVDPLSKLDRWALNVGEGTKYTVVAGLRSKNDVARVAFKDDEAGIGWHLSLYLHTTARAGNDRLRDDVYALL